MGAAKAVLVSDATLAGADALTTAKVLAGAVGKAGDYDLIIAGTESSDGYTGTVPEQLAELLGLPSITFAKNVEIADGTLKVNRQTEEGYDEVTCSLPAVVSASPPASSSPVTRASRASWPRSRSRSTRSRPPTSASRPSSWAGSRS